MDKSLFRRFDRLELLCCYALCFLLNILFDYAKNVKFDSYFLQTFFKQFYDYQALIMFSFSFLVVVFHYQILQRKKKEVHCRILVGDTISVITKRYCCECLIILGMQLIQAVPHEHEDDFIVPEHYQTITKRLKKLADANGFQLTFHDLRHLNASVMLMLGVPNKYAQERGGWSTDTTLKNVYQHTFSEERERVDEMINRFFENTLEELED